MTISRQYSPIWCHEGHEVIWLRQSLEAARQTFILQSRSKMTLVVASLGVAIAVLSIFLPDAAARRSSGIDFFGIGVYALGFQFALPVIVLYYGVAAVHDDLSDGTVTYHFVRPVHRSSLLLGKWLAVSLLCWALASILLGLLYLAFALPEHPWRFGLGVPGKLLGSFCIAAAYACPAYAAVGMLCGAWFKRPIVWAAIFVVGWEFIASNLPPEAGIRGATVADPVRRWLLMDLDLDARSDLSEVLTGTLQGYEASNFGDPFASLALFTGVVLTVCVWLYTRREYEAQARD